MTPVLPVAMPAFRNEVNGLMVSAFQYLSLSCANLMTGVQPSPCWRLLDVVVVGLEEVEDQLLDHVPVLGRRRDGEAREGDPALRSPC